MSNRRFNTRKLTGYLVTIALLLAVNAGVALAQTTAFTYQGKLVDNGAPASGNYDLTFKLFDTASVGSGVQQGTTLSLTNVTVGGGVFTVTLDFGACASCFNGAARFLEISVKATSGSTFTTLSPRQQLTATPYALKSVSAASADGLSVTCVSCVTSSQIQSVNGSAVSGVIPVASVPAGSNNYIQNQNGGIQPGDFKINGRGAFGGRVGIGTYAPTATLHVVGLDMRFESPSVGSGTFPRFAMSYTQAAANEKQWHNYVSTDSLIFSAVDDLGIEQPQGRWLQVIRVGTSVSGITFPNGKVGIGTFSPIASLHIESPTATSADNTARFAAFAIGPATSHIHYGTTGDWYIRSASAVGKVILQDTGGNVGIGRANPTATLDVNGNIRFNSLGGAGGTSLCLNSSSFISFCSSSRRYKENIADFSSGLNLLNQLRRVTFDWKESKAHDLGLVAEEVAEVEPLLITRNQQGEVEGVKYDRLGVVLINAIKEQQAQIERQQSQLERQQAEIESLKKLVCSSHPKVGVCK